VSEELLEGDDDLVLYQGHPFTGVAYDLFASGDLYHETNYQDGLPHGYWRDWYPTGQMKFESECQEGVRHGRTTRWYPNGAMQFIAQYEFGIETDYCEWDESGKIVLERVLTPDSPGANYSLLLARRMARQKKSTA
jgi:antitoxin component YwqK of YwqJK toxin-antitoxin module